MNSYRYYKWDGKEPFPCDREKLVEELSRKMMADGNLSRAIWDIQYAGFRDRQNKKFPSLEDLLHKLQSMKQNQLCRYNLESVMDDIRQKLQDIVETEKKGINQLLLEVRQRTRAKQGELPPEIRQKLLQSLEDKATGNLAFLDNLPFDMGGQVKELNKYEFMDQIARQKFTELMDMLKKRAVDTYARELGQTLQKLDQRTISQLRQMVRDLNDMLEKPQGIGPDFNEFMKKYINFFGSNPPQSLDELMQRLQDQISEARSLLNSMSTEKKESLQDIIDSVMDRETREELLRLGANLQSLYPGGGLPDRYSFSGDESISYSAALNLMSTLQKMDRLEYQIRQSKFNRSIDSIDRKIVREVLGEQSAEELDAISNITKELESSGYIRLEKDKYCLTPRGIRKIGEKALGTIYSRLKRDRTGGHRISMQGGGGERLEDTKQYEFGDNFDLHLEKTIMNALMRKPENPVKLESDDFEVYKEERVSRSATVLMLDLSLSMPMHGNFQAAKIVAIALDTLITGKYPKDSLYLLGFSSYARRMTREELTRISWDDFDPYTNMQHGFMLARKILGKDRSNNKQIILISDGEPTAHLENGQVFFQYPPSFRSIQLTLNEVGKCTKNGIIINTFMLRGSGYFNSFVNELARLNRGRVFFTSAENLGRFVIVDYIANKNQKII